METLRFPLLVSNKTAANFKLPISLPSVAVLVLFVQTKSGGFYDPHFNSRARSLNRPNIRSIGLTLGRWGLSACGHAQAGIGPYSYCSGKLLEGRYRPFQEIIGQGNGIRSSLFRHGYKKFTRGKGLKVQGVINNSGQCGTRGSGSRSLESTRRDRQTERSRRG